MKKFPLSILTMTAVLAGPVPASAQTLPASTEIELAKIELGGAFRELDDGTDRRACWFVGQAETRLLAIWSASPEASSIVNEIDYASSFCNVGDYDSLLGERIGMRKARKRAANSVRRFGSS